MALQVPTVSIDDLRDFHAKHFPHTPAPEHFLHGVEPETVETHHDEVDDELGYYPDGARRTLSDEQIAMFRHSEIQDILRARRSRQEDGELSDEGNTPVVSSAPETHVTTLTAQSHPGKGQFDEVEKPKTQQWATSSARTKAKNRRNREKYRAKLKAIRRENEQQKDTNHTPEADESDEWDPWHQANGPDAQKNEALDLDY